MAGTKEGALKGRDTVYKKYGKDYYRELGHCGKGTSRNGGFASLKVGKDGLTGPERSRKYAKSVRKNK